MKKKLLAGLATGTFLICGLGTAFATPIQMGSATWINDGVQHEYTLYSYESSDNKNWAATSEWIALQTHGKSYLATITSESEDQFINTMFTAQKFTGEVWLGGFQIQSDFQKDPTAQWHWVTGEAWSYINWANGEANDYYGERSEQYLGGNWGGKWNDEGALGNIKGFVVETTAPVPEPTTMLLFGTGLIGLAAVGRRKRS